MAALIVLTEVFLGLMLFDLTGKFIALAGGAFDLHGKATFEVAGDVAFNASDIVEIDDGPIAERRCVGRNKQRLIGRHFDCLTGNFELIGQHASPEQSDGCRAISGAGRFFWRLKNGRIHRIFANTRGQSSLTTG